MDDVRLAFFSITMMSSLSLSSVSFVISGTRSGSSGLFSDIASSLEVSMRLPTARWCVQSTGRLRCEGFQTNCPGYYDS
jgi:hypothetical protein